LRQTAGLGRRSSPSVVRQAHHERSATSFALRLSKGCLDLANALERGSTGSPRTEHKAVRPEPVEGLVRSGECTRAWFDKLTTNGTQRRSPCRTCSPRTEHKAVRPVQRDLHERNTKPFALSLSKGWFDLANAPRAASRRRTTRDASPRRPRRLRAAGTHPAANKRLTRLTYAAGSSSATPSSNCA